MTTKTAAIAAAKSAVIMYRSGSSSWTITGPYNATHDGLFGMTTSVDKSDFFAARRTRTRWVASLALSLIGWSSDDASYAANYYDGSVDEIVSAALKAAA